MIYLDANATTGLSKVVLDEMRVRLDEMEYHVGAPYREAKKMARLVQESKLKLKSILKAQKYEMILTSGGTESIHTALYAAWQSRGKKTILVIGSTEHSAVESAAVTWERLGGRVAVIEHDEKGRLNEEKYLKLLKEGEVACVSLMWVNHETGLIYPIEGWVKAAHEYAAFFHLDGVQALGKVDVQLDKIGADWISFSMHKWHGCKGVGVLAVREHSRFVPFIAGKGKEDELRAGTQAVFSVSATVKGMEELLLNCAQDQEKIRQIRDFFENTVLGWPWQKWGVECHIIGQREKRVGNTTFLVLPQVDTGALILLMDQEGVAISSGAACQSGNPLGSKVLRGMGFPQEWAKHTLRWSWSRYNTMEETELALEKFKKIVERLVDRGLTSSGGWVVVQS